MFSKEDINDIQSICEEITNHFIAEDHQSRDYCKFCNTVYGNVNNVLGGKIEHREDCEVLKAQKILKKIYNEKWFGIVLTNLKLPSKIVAS